MNERVRAGNGGTMAVNWWTLRILVVVAASLWLTADASAMSAFARKYGMQCDGCHSRIPKLNEFGTAFLKNGFAIPAGAHPPVSTARKPESEIEPTASIPVPRESHEPATSAAPAGSPEGVVVSDRSVEPLPEQTATEAPPPPPPMVLYKLKARDGSAYYTDNPRAAADLQEPAASPARKAAGRTHGKAVPEAKAPARRRSPVAPDAAPPAFRSFSECMEHQLVDTPPPGSAGEMMDLLTEAERVCAGYPAAKR
ncbi:cytochrome C [Geobacter sulfurreducens]|uniref:cytochrome C n=1 Tax=Geobacter sulfurreducens TaxID=35554 RepID=UPI000DBBB13E|nr:cytochrome C [Geobacter sulfurreducens]BBA69594.1 C-type cytochrome [Geobacter sulfurreducens]